MNNRNLSDFFDKEYKQQAQNANFTKISNMFGLKYTANKVACTVLSKNITNWQKVEVVSSVTALETLYMGGSSNIDGVIVNMASSYVGANNFPIMDSKGDFGGRLNNISAASRYIFTRKHNNFDKIFNPVDLNILSRYNFEGEDIEYQFLTFSVPLLLINGAEGMGSGHAQKILPTKLEDTITYIKEYLKTKKESPLHVYYNGFTGTITQGDSNSQWVITGALKRLNRSSTEIFEVPVNESYKSYNAKLDKLVEQHVIKSYVDLCDPKTDTFKYIITHSTGFADQSDEEMLLKLKLVSRVSENYTVIDELNSVKVFETRQELMNHYIAIKLQFLQKRKDYIIEKLKYDIDTDNSKIAFIEKVVNNELIINKRKKTDITDDLKLISEIHPRDNNYDYLLNMSIMSLTEERIETLKTSVQNKLKELVTTEKTTIEQMWIKELEVL